MKLRRKTPFTLMKLFRNACVRAASQVAPTMVGLMFFSAAHADEVEFDRLITLTPTPAAPANAAGTGRAVFGFVDVGAVIGIPTNRFEVAVSGLLPGTYSVQLYNYEAPTTNEIGGGWFTVGENDTGTVSAVVANVPYYVGPSTLRDFTIMDSNNVILRGDFADVTAMKSGRVQATVPVEPRELAAAASGTAAINGTAKNGRARGTFRLLAENLPAQTNLLLRITGAEDKLVRSSRRGQIRVRSSAKKVNLFTLSTVSIRDSSTNELAHAEF